jgi:hypothetical protein
MRFHSPATRLIPFGSGRYIGISPGLFDHLVADERVPQPKPIRSRLVWDRCELDRAFSALPMRAANHLSATDYAVAAFRLGTPRRKISRLAKLPKLNVVGSIPIARSSHLVI